ncbi:hypothetical protein ACFIJ5_10550 [Haloimpatiens sp. FM7330]|uniref:hypothetical protein n=1 Tax=Haloimpatiens sp. FM7330 TaxID=3298610 RepID=UPI0036317F07
MREAKELCKELNEIVYKVAKLIQDKFDKIKEETYKFQCLKQFNFNELSIFILSDVLLDSIQIDNVERIFLKTERTKRNGMNYYYSLQEKYNHIQKEALGIYGNMFRYYGDIAFGLYGNNRNGINFHTINKAHLEMHLGSLEFESVSDIKQYLLEELIKCYYEKNYKLDKNIVNVFNSLSIMKGNRIDVPILSKNEFYRLNNIADIIKNGYINILEKSRKSIYYNYNNSTYSQEISFEEYFIWWYHLLYSKVTDLLIERSIIKKPITDNFSYVVI